MCQPCGRIIKVVPALPLSEPAKGTGQVFNRGFYQRTCASRICDRLRQSILISTTKTIGVGAKLSPSEDPSWSPTVPGSDAQANCCWKNDWRQGIVCETCYRLFRRKRVLRDPKQRNWKRRRPSGQDCTWLRIVPRRLIFHWCNTFVYECEIFNITTNR